MKRIFAGLSDAVDALEGAYVDVKKNIAVGVDGVSVTSYAVKNGALYNKEIKVVNGIASLMVMQNGGITGAGK